LWILAILFIAVAAVSVKKNATPLRDELLGQFEPEVHPDFVKFPIDSTESRPFYLRRAAAEKLLEMMADAKAAGIDIKVVSATRTFNQQRRIWEAKWIGSQLVDGVNLEETLQDPVKRAREILRYSSMPGTSRHHWGTDVDLNELNNAWFKKGEGKQLYEWLISNASKYGYCQPYTSKKSGRAGYEEERWHWSYKPLSAEFLQLYKDSIQHSDLVGFKGALTTKKVKVIADYVLGIDESCLIKETPAIKPDRLLLDTLQTPMQKDSLKTLDSLGLDSLPVSYKLKPLDSAISDSAADSLPKTKIPIDSTKPN
jgi:LAS superfamily LD-carboxypeptidase LdcB